MLVSVAQPAGFFASRGLSGNIGTEILRRFIVTLDVPANKLFIRPDADFSEPMVFDRAGVSVLPHDDGWRAEFVIPGGPADQAGIAAGDLVISLNGKPPAALGPDGLRDFELGPVGSVFQVVFEHNGTRYTKSLVLRDILQLRSELHICRLRHMQYSRRLYARCGCGYLINCIARRVRHEQTP